MNQFLVTFDNIYFTNIKIIMDYDHIYYHLLYSLNYHINLLMNQLIFFHNINQYDVIYFYYLDCLKNFIQLIKIYSSILFFYYNIEIIKLL